MLAKFPKTSWSLIVNKYNDRVRLNNGVGMMNNVGMVVVVQTELTASLFVDSPQSSANQVKNMQMFIGHLQDSCSEC